MLTSEGTKENFTSLCTHKKPKFQRKYKPRMITNSVVENQLSHDDKFEHIQQGSKAQSYYKDRSKSVLFKNRQYQFDDSFYKTSCKLQDLNFKHHDPNLCVCEYCTCGRHLCQFHAVKPDLSKKTVYQKDYLKKNPIGNKINISKEYDRYTGPNLDVNSIYLKDYDGKQGQIERPHPQDLLKTGGPCNNLTSYSSGFPGYRGGNQYVKPTDKHTRDKFPFRARSTYSNYFKGDPGKRSDLEKVPDNLKTGYNWYGSTTYGNKFLPPNPQDYAKKYKIYQKLEKNPDYNHQYETIYGHSFLGRQPGVCQAKVIIETRSKGFFSTSKQRFSQNADFKSLDPSYHAISTSKHFYV